MVKVLGKNAERMARLCREGGRSGPPRRAGAQSAAEAQPGLPGARRRFPLHEDSPGAVGDFPGRRDPDSAGKAGGSHPGRPFSPGAGGDFPGRHNPDGAGKAEALGFHPPVLHPPGRRRAARSRKRQGRAARAAASPSPAAFAGRAARRRHGRRASPSSARRRATGAARRAAPRERPEAQVPLARLDARQGARADPRQGAGGAGRVDPRPPDPGLRHSQDRLPIVAGFRAPSSARRGVPGGRQGCLPKTLNVICRSASRAGSCRNRQASSGTGALVAEAAWTQFRP